MSFPRIPDDIIIACYEESEKQQLANGPLVHYLQNNRIALFSYKRSDAKYGKNENERLNFWQNIICRENYEAFFNKFPKNNEINLNGVKYVL